MTRTVTIHLEEPIVSAKILDNSSPARGGPGRNLPQGIPRFIGADYESSDGSGQTMMQDSKTHNPDKSGLSQACQILKALIEKMNQFCDRLFAEHREEIAKLSVEIARKVLARQVQNGDYEIESIIGEALKNAPTRKDLVAHLNPEDHILLQKALQSATADKASPQDALRCCGDDSNSDLAGIKFILDPNIGRAECLLESPKGIIESLIDEHLERISDALKTAE
jgi:flagellar biosynthesis/type III secretory pathway protein FliH